MNVILPSRAMAMVGVTVLAPPKAVPSRPTSATCMLFAVEALATVGNVTR